jgi:chemotaxis-related protein WspD
LIVQNGLLATVAIDMSAPDDQLPHPQQAVVNDCWNRIGVHGDHSCAELTRHIHCRNCAVYRASARTLLDKPTTAEHSSFWTQHHSQPLQPIESATRSVTIFRVGSERFAIGTLLCVEVAGPRPIHGLPHRRGGAVLGLANIHGELVVCISLPALLSLTTASQPQTAAAAAGRLLVTRWRDGPIAFPVDEVAGVQKFASQYFKPLPATVAHAKARCTSSVLSYGTHTLGVLDEELLGQAIKRNLA